MYTFGLLLILMSGAAVSCAQSTKYTTFNAPKHIKLTVKNFSDALNLKEGELGRWRIVNTENRTTILATKGDTISWTAGDDIALQFQFPERLSKRLFEVIDGDRDLFKEKFSFNLQKGETLTVKVKNPDVKGNDDIFVLTYAVLNITDNELVASDSPPRIIFMINQ